MILVPSGHPVVRLFLVSQHDFAPLLFTCLLQRIMSYSPNAFVFYGYIINLMATKYTLPMKQQQNQASTIALWIN